VPRTPWQRFCGPNCRKRAWERTKVQRIMERFEREARTLLERVLTEEWDG